MAKKLEKYQKMRDFGVTPEPRGLQRPRKARLPIFVVQKHAASHLHYDFRLEIDGVLKSWAVPKGPSYDPSIKRLAMMTEDHPNEYASFEGVIPEGNYGAGNVIIWDEGTWEYIGPGDDPGESVRKGEIKFALEGTKLKGEWALIHLRGRSRKQNEWLLIKHRDGYATDKLDITDYSKSVVSGKSLEQMGGGEVWISNRKSGKVQTMADRVRAAGSGKARGSGKPAPGKKTARKSASSKKRETKAAAPRKAKKK